MSQPELPPLYEFDLNGFEKKAASNQNGIDLYEGHWISALPGLDAGKMALFAKRDDRPQFLIDALGGVDGKSILELGSFEGGHAYQLEKAGARVIGIEANPHIFVRSVLVKNALDLDAKFLLGNYVPYLEDCDRFDAIFCSGVLYHDVDPVGLLRRISEKTDAVFIWTHYVSEEAAKTWQPVTQYDEDGFSCTYYRFDYDAVAGYRSFAGVESFCSRIEKNDIIDALKHLGFDKVEVCKDEPDHVGGPAISLVAQRTRGASEKAA